MTSNKKMTTAERLARSFAALSTLDYTRTQSGNELLGSSMEKQILDIELNDLEFQTNLDDIDQDLEAKRKAAGNVD